MNKIHLASGVAAMLITAGAAGASTVTSVHFNTGKSWNSAGHTYGASDEVKVTGAIVDTNGKIKSNDEFVASWSGSSGGLGICSASKKHKCTGSTSENNGRDQHTIDGRNGDEMALLDFGSLNVEITSVTFNYWEKYDQFSYAVFDSLAVHSKPTVWKEDIDYGSNNSPRTFNFAKGTLVGSLFGFGADGNHEEYKLKGITYKVIETPVVPLPAAGWMLLAGLGGLAASKRRKKA